MRSWKECHRLITAIEATETQTNPVGLLHYTTGGIGVGLPEDGISLPNGEDHPLAGNGITARVPDVTAAVLEMSHTDPAPTPQVIIVVTDTGATQSLLKYLRKATRRAGEGMSDGFSLASSPNGLFCLRAFIYVGRIKTCSSGS